MAVDIQSKQNLEDEVYQKDGYVLLNLWAAWCRPCQVMEPTLKFAEEKFLLQIRSRRTGSTG